MGLDVGAKHSNTAMVKKALALLDTVLGQNSGLAFLDKLPGKRDDAAANLLALVQGEASGLDLDTSEKALALVNRIVGIRPMLFGSNFRQDLAAAVRVANDKCMEQ